MPPSHNGFHAVCMPEFSPSIRNLHPDQRKRQIRPTYEPASAPETILPRNAFGRIVSVRHWQDRGIGSRLTDGNDHPSRIADPGVQELEPLVNLVQWEDRCVKLRNTSPHRGYRHGGDFLTLT